MKVCIVGTGYVGIVTGACLADSGNHVVCVDKDADKVARLTRGESPIYEPGLRELLQDNIAAGRISFTTDLSAAVATARVVFIAVGTPPRADGSADLSAIEAVSLAIGRALRATTVIVNKSTVPVGTCERIRAWVAQHAQHPFTVASNPEFLKEGSAVEDFMRPDRVVIGAADAATFATLEELHAPFVRNNKPIMHLSIRAAEMSKHAANAFLATRISFINEVSEMCERLDVDVNEVRRAMGSDARIGHHFLYPGVGYGGSCFPKDVLALAHSGGAVGVQCGILQAVHARNVRQREALFERVVARLGGLRDRRVAVWGLAYKPKTDDIREAPAVYLIHMLCEAGAIVSAYDPQAAQNARRAVGARVEFGTDAYAVLQAADALLICTEWNEFRNPDFDRMRGLMRQPLIFDGRNLYDPRAMRRNRFEYHSIGRPTVEFLSHA